MGIQRYCVPTDIGSRQSQRGNLVADFFHPSFAWNFFHEEISILWITRCLNKAGRPVERRAKGLSLPAPHRCTSGRPEQKTPQCGHNCRSRLNCNYCHNFSGCPRIPALPGRAAASTPACPRPVRPRALIPQLSDWRWPCLVSVAPPELRITVSCRRPSVQRWL